jgi:hypothetical protein
VDTKSKFLFFGLLTFLLAAQCRRKSNADKSSQRTTSLQTKTFATTKFDTIIKQLNNNSELTKDDLLEIKVFDTTNAYSLSETGYCDTTVQLNDSVFYSIISINDEAGLCTHFYIASINKKSKKG